MFLKKIDGPRAVRLADGTILTQADLPPRSTRRWVASRKACVIKAMKHGLIRREEARDRYMLSDEELDEWEKAFDTYGEAALRTTALQKFRQP